MALALIKSFSVAALCDVTSEHLQIPHGRSLRQQIIAIIITFIVVGRSDAENHLSVAQHRVCCRRAGC